MEKHLLFVSDTSGSVNSISLLKHTNTTMNTMILSPSTINFLPLELSVDWLNDQLYILGEVKHKQTVWQITRCSLDGRRLQVAIAGLRHKPHHIEVDPYNGYKIFSKFIRNIYFMVLTHTYSFRYLFWVVRGYNKGGLYRLDLSDISNGIKHSIQPEIILSEPNLGAFTVDHTNFRLLVSNQNQSTVNSVSLDG